MESVLRAWYDAADPDALARAEDALLAASAGPLRTGAPIGLGPVPVVPAAADPIAAEAEWLAGARIPAGGPRCPTLFGVPGTEDRGTRIAHLEVGFPVPHPVLGATIRRIPVVPPALRPPLVADGVYGTPAADVLYAALARWLAIGAAHPVEVLDYLTPVLRALLTAGSTGPWTRWSAPEPWAPAPSEPKDELRLMFSGVLFTGHHLAFDNGQVTIYDLDSARVVERLASRGAELVSIDDGHAVFVARGPTGGTVRPRESAIEATVQTMERIGLPFDRAEAEASYAHLPEEDDEEAERFYAISRSDGRWTAVPSHVPQVRFEEALERSLLCRGDGATALLLEVDDYPTVVAFTVDRRFVWVEDKHGNGGIFRTSDAARVAELPEPDELPAGTPWLDGHAFAPYAPPDEEDEDDAPPRESPAALAQAPDGAFLTLRDGIACRDGHPILGVSGHIRWAALRDDGAFLAIVSLEDFGSHRLRVVSLAEPPEIRIDRSIG